MNSLHDTYHRPLFPRGPGLGLKTLFLMLLALTLIFYDTRGDSLKAARAWAAYALTPVVWLSAVPGRLVNFVRGIDTPGSLERENRALRQQQFVLESQLGRMAALEAENRRLRELLASSARLPEQVLIAEIVQVSQDPYRHQITLSRGSRDGIYRGQALVDAHGVMGQVVEIAPNHSTALLVTDPNHGIPIEINRTGLQTIAVGLGDNRGLRLPFLPSNADIKTGDLLVSSSLGGRFPAGYPVGTVYAVKPVAGEHFMEAYAYPAAKLNQGRQALMVWNRNALSQAPAEAIVLETPAPTRPMPQPGPARIQVPERILPAGAAPAVPAGAGTPADAASPVSPPPVAPAATPGSAPGTAVLPAPASAAANAPASSATPARPALTTPPAPAATPVPRSPTPPATPAPAPAAARETPPAGTPPR